MPPQDCSGEDGAYPEGLDPGNSAASPEPGAGAKLPPVLANLMGSVGAGKGPPGPPQNAPINMQEILSSIMVTTRKRRKFGEDGGGGNKLRGVTPQPWEILKSGEGLKLQRSQIWGYKLGSTPPHPLNPKFGINQNREGGTNCGHHRFRGHLKLGHYNL